MAKTDTPGIDFALQGSAGAIRGRITQVGNGGPLSFIPTAAIDLATGTRFLGNSTDGSGHYLIPLPPGRYQVQANPGDSPNYNPAYETRDSSGPVEVTADQVTPDIDLAIASIVGPDLTGSWEGQVTPSCRGSGAQLKCSVKGTFALQNQGTAKTPKKSLLRFYLSSDATFDGSDLFLKAITVAPLKAGQSQKKPFRANLRTGSGASGQYVIALVDAADVVAETNEMNNRLVFGPLP